MKLSNSTMAHELPSFDTISPPDFEYDGRSYALIDDSAGEDIVLSVPGIASSIVGCTYHPEDDGATSTWYVNISR